MPMPARRAVVVSFDRFHVGYLGCYGNDWIETPNLDRLASRAVVFDQYFCDNLDPGAANHAWWTGRAQFPLAAEAQRACATFVEQFEAARVHTWLMAESDGREEVQVAPPFENVATVRGSDGLDLPETETPFARLVENACGWLQGSRGTQTSELLWIKSRGVPVPWLPPRGFADLYLDEFGLTGDSQEADEGEQAGGEEAEPTERGAEATPRESDEEAAEIDESLEWRYAAPMYAAYVTLLDRWFGKLLAALEQSPTWRDALLIVCAGEGQSLGEHLPAGTEGSPLRAECVHVPLWVRVPGSDQGGTRHSALVQTSDLASTLLEWFGIGGQAPQSAAESNLLTGRSLLPLVRNETESVRDALLLGCDRREWGIRTADFFYVEEGDAANPSTAAPALLFEKPHDRWDQSDVLSQYPQVAEDLRERLLGTIGVKPASGPA